MMTPTDLFEFQNPGDGWTLHSGTAPRRLFIYSLSATIKDRIFTARHIVSEEDVRDGYGRMRLAEETVQRLLEKERAKQP